MGGLGRQTSVIKNKCKKHLDDNNGEKDGCMAFE